MYSLLMSLRMEPEMVAELKALARKETARRGEKVSWARLMREGAARLLQEAKQQRAETAALACDTAACPPWTGSVQ